MAEAQAAKDDKAADKSETDPDPLVVVVQLDEKLATAIAEETSKQLNVPKEKVLVKVGQRIWIGPNSCRAVSDDKHKQGRFYLAYGWYTVLQCIQGELYKVQRLAQRQDSKIVEFGPAEGKITSAHLRTLILFEAILERMSQGSRNPIAAAAAAGPGAGPPLRANQWTVIYDCLSPRRSLGVFSFEFDAGLLGLMLSCRRMYHLISMHPVWITSVLSLSYKHVAAVLACPGLTCAGVARYISFNAARLPDVIRKDPEFRNILRPETRHAILQKQAAALAQPSAEIPPKLRAVQVLGTFLIGEPQYRGDVDKDPITAELVALCRKIAQDDPLFVLKLAHYVRNTLTFRNTTNFLLATAAQIESCRPFVRTALPKCTNLPTDLLELWDFWRKLSGSISLPACLKKGFADKFTEFGEYQLGKYLNAKVPKSSQVAPPPAKKGKGKGRGRGGAAAAPVDPEAEKAAAAEALAKRNDPKTRPLTLKGLIRTVHAGKGNTEAVCGVLRKRYPETEEEFKAMHLDAGGAKDFDPARSGEKLRIPVPRTWETELSEKGNTPEVWEGLIKSRALPFMAMLRNLRNVLLAGVDDETHKMLMDRLKSPKEVSKSKQMPIRFLSAFEAIDFDEAKLAQLAEEAQSGQEFIEEEKAVGTGKEAKKIMKKRRVCMRPPTKKLLDGYRDALEKAVSLAATHNVPPLECPTPGAKALILVDVSGSMEGPLTQGPKKMHESALTPHRRSSGRPIVEGQDMDLEDYFSQSGQRLSKKVSVSQTWIGQDLDLSVMVLDKDGAQVCSVSYSNTNWTQIWHSGDITSAPYGAEEVISVDLEKLPANAFMLMFTVNSYSGQTFDELPEAAISLRDDGLAGDSVEGTQEICAFRLTGKARAVIACALIRKERGWSFRCLNTPQEHGMTVQSLLGKIKKEYDAAMADAATSQKRLVDAALLLALCLRERMGDDKCEVVLFSSPGTDGGPGYHVLRGLGPKVLANVRRCNAAASYLGRGTELPIAYLQELAAARVPLDHLVVLTDGLIAPAKSPADALGRWLRAYRSQVQPIKFACIDLLGLGRPSLGEGSTAQDVLISGFSEATLRYLTQEPGAQLQEVESVQLPPPKEPSKDKDAGGASFAPPPRVPAVPAAGGEEEEEA